MNVLTVLGFQIQMGLFEIIIFQIGAIILGFSIHFFWTSRKSSIPSSARDHSVLAESTIDPGDEWRLKYYELSESSEKLHKKLQKELEDVKDNENILNIEIEEIKKEYKKLRDTPPPPPPAPENDATTYLDQLKTAQHNLFEHNNQISKLLNQIDQLKETEKKQSETLKVNDDLATEVKELRKNLGEKDSEIRQIRQQNTLTREMSERIEKAYAEFNQLNEHLQNLQNYVSKPENRSFEYEQMQQSYFRLTKEYDEIKLRQLSMLEENQRLSRLLADSEDKLRESNFQRQQLGKKVNFLEELNRDLQQAGEHQKKLETQLKRIGEIESLITRIQGLSKD